MDDLHEQYPASDVQALAPRTEGMDIGEDGRIAKSFYLGTRISPTPWRRSNPTNARQRLETLDHFFLLGQPQLLPPQSGRDIDRDLDLPQWADLGMYLQTVVLLRGSAPSTTELLSSAIAAIPHFNYACRQCLASDGC
jgi:hypothetical protein